MKLPIRMLPVLGVALVIALGPASAQERLETVLERGYAVEWLVCGPLPSDLPGGILEAVDKGTLPLSETDYLAGMGGVSRARPKAQAKIDVGGVSSEWTELRAEGPALDLTGLFVDRRQGVAYAAFYTHSDWARTVYFDIQTPLGARIWVNGFPARNVRATPLSAAGLDRFTADLRVGRNLIMIQAPLADVESMASRASLTPREFRARTFRNRPLLTDTTGFEMGLRILPAQPVGPLIVVPRLEAMGSFSGKAGAMHQDALLTLFNPEGSLSNTIGVTMSVVGVAEPVKQAILPIAPQTQKEALLSIPIGDASPGQSVDVQVTVTSGRDSVSFPARLNARRAPSQGKMFVVTGGRYRAGTSEDQRARVKRRMDEIDRNLVLLENEPDYGFDLAEAEAWESHWLTRPAMRDRLADAANLGRAAPHAGYSLPDERIVGGEVLVRNLAYGHFTADALLARRGGCYLAWNAVGVCPQLPQILAKTTGLGVISALPVRGLPAVFQQLGPDGSAMVHRRREPSRAPASATDLRELAIVQRRELLHLGLDTDVLVVESDVPPPEPFYLGACRDLARSVPSVRVTGSGGEEFLLAAQEAVEQQGLPVPRAGRAMTATEPGMLLAQPAIKQAHTRVESILITTEKLATLAALQGARYPHHTLDYAWRQVIYNSRVDRLGLAPTPGVYLDMLAGYRDAEAVTRRTLNASTAFLASRVNTYAGLQSNKEGAMAFVVFNPSSWIRTDVCDANVSLPRSRGFTVLDDQGDPVPFTLSDPGTAGSRLQVVATDVPPLGYRTYYLMPEGRPVQPTTDDGLVIENDYSRVEIDRAQGGGIAVLTAEETGEEDARGLLNDAIAVEALAELDNSGKDFWTT
ncbi:MAG: hypothetical protein GY851_29205, partial [bacterium]|nr:hypothetical protein [bacterium]